MTVDQPSTTRRRFVQAVGGAAATVTATGAITTTAAGETTQQEGGTLTYARGADSESLDPQNTTSGETAKVTNQIYDSLIEFEPGGTSLVEGLATEWTQEETTVNLTLREGVTFHNGEPFTASDVIVTWRRFTDQESDVFAGDDYVSGYTGFTFGEVADMSADGDLDLTVELTQPFAPILRNLAMFAATIHSEAAIRELGNDLATNPVGTGPFVFEEWDTANQRIRLSRNDDFWGQVPSVDEVVFTAIGSNTSRAQTLASGDADIIDGMGPQSVEIVENSGSAEVVRTEGLNVGYMAMNMARFEPFRDRRVRQAINLAIDTESIVNTIFQGIAVQSSQPIPPNILGFNEELEPYPHDPEQAQSLLEEAGFGDGFSFELATFRNPRPYNPSPIQAAEVVRSNLSEVGIEVEINQQPFNPFLDFIQSGRHDATFIGWITDNGDPDNFYFSLLHPQLPEEKLPPEDQDWVDAWGDPDFQVLNSAAWANREFMSLVEEGRTTLDSEARAEFYREAGRIAHDEAPWVFMDHAEELRGVSNRVEGFVVAPIRGPFLNLVSLTG